MSEVQSIFPVFSYFWQLIKAWGWLILPFIFWKPFIYFWLWWRNENWLDAVYKPILLEIKIPKEVLKPIRAMESVMDSIQGSMIQPPDWWERWIDGQVQTSASFEIVSIGGEIHFYVRFHYPYREAIEASIYAQFPEAEINQAEDYTKHIPQDIPNKDWDLFGADYKTIKDDHYPIKTYRSFETEQEKEEEKRIDPVSGLLEALAKIKPGEQFWIQITAEPLSDADADPGILFGLFGKVNGSSSEWIDKGKMIRDTLARRPDSKSKPYKPMTLEAADLLITGKMPGEEEEKKEEIIPPEMKLTPGEREIIVAFEEKMSKPAFRVHIRFIYLGKREVWFKPNFRLAFAFFNEYTTTNLNAIFPMGSSKTLTKIRKHWFFPINRLNRRRLYLRERKILRNYIGRYSPFFPKSGGTFVLNTEELASLFHFPSWVISPVSGVSRVETKKGPPPNVPTE